MTAIAGRAPNRPYIADWPGHVIKYQQYKCAHCVVEGFNLKLYLCECGFKDACLDCIKEHLKEHRPRKPTSQKHILLARRKKVLGY